MPRQNRETSPATPSRRLPMVRDSSNSPITSPSRRSGRQPKPFRFYDDENDHLSPLRGLNMPRQTRETSPATPSRRLRMVRGSSNSPITSPSRRSGRQPKPIRFYDDENEDPIAETPTKERKPASKNVASRKNGGGNDTSFHKTSPVKTGSDRGKDTRSPRKFRVCCDDTDSNPDEPARHVDSKGPNSPRKQANAQGSKASSSPATPTPKNAAPQEAGAKKRTGNVRKQPAMLRVPIKYDPPVSDAECVTDDAEHADAVGVPPEFRPAHFLRCHSTRGDPADVQTEVWSCQFQPGRRDVVATVGGRSVCLMNTTSGLLLKKFTHPSPTEKLGTLAWLRFHVDVAAGSDRRLTILAVGGVDHVHLIHPDNLTWYDSFQVGEDKNCDVTAMAAHPRRSRWLLVATGDGFVSLWDVGVPTPPLYNVHPMSLMKLSISEPALSLVFVPGPELLLAASDDGLVGWRLTLDTIRDGIVPSDIVYDLPPPASRNKTKKHENDGNEVTALAILGGSHLAVKCVDRGCVYIWPIASVMPESPISRRVNLTSAPRSLRWSDTDECYLGMGAGRTLLAAGDDRGDVWLYNWRCDDDSNPRVLKWPRPVDDELVRAGKVPLHKFDILVHSACLNESEGSLVAVTHNNMVCVWHRVDTEQKSAEDRNDDDRMEVD